ncbi:hypothetical protein [Sulfurisphaera tokodaii]|uniref:Uncharacterized protein n=1 Tax=Sulfurisphaera tokodaii TaxID=111955 RepID=A0A832WQQ2_9CREN|nr:hypothetical protein [Sulfurisphaera tokodaii]HII73357.1 hypothetical protein [Sulfurisphaera tokodaii]
MKIWGTIDCYNSSELFSAHTGKLDRERLKGQKEVNSTKEVIWKILNN